MVKLYYPNGDELQGAKPLDELLWFPEHQSQLLRLANTNEGRDILCIDSVSKKPYPIVKVRKNFVQYHLGGNHYQTDFRVGAKWGNVIRSRWLEFKKALERQSFLDLMAWPAVYDQGRLLHPIGGGTETTFFPNANVESTSVDGEVGEGENANWATIRADTGNAASPSGVDMNTAIGSVGGLPADWSRVFRCIILFDTGNLGSDTIDSAVLGLVYSSKEESLSPGGKISVVESDPATNTNLVTGDYGQLSTTKLATDITLATLTADSSTYNDYTLNATGLALVLSITKLGTVQQQDNDDAEPTSGNGDNRAIARAADTSGTSTDPKLVVNHTAVFTPKVIMF